MKIGDVSMHISSKKVKLLLVAVGSFLLPLSGVNLEAHGKNESSKHHVAKNTHCKRTYHWDESTDATSNEPKHAFFMGAAYGPKKTSQNVDLVAVDLNDTTGQKTTFLAPLLYGSPSERNTDAPFSFYRYKPATDPKDATRGFFLIHEEGRYLLQYGLTAIPNDLLLGELWYYLVPHATVWMAIQIENRGHKTLVGAVPLSLTMTQSFDIHNPSLLPPNYEGQILSGFGQIALKLREGDQVTLQIFVGSNYDSSDGTGDRILYIHNDNINLPYMAGTASRPLTRGPTLAVTKMD